MHSLYACPEHLMSDTLLWQHILQVAESADLKEQVSHSPTGLAAVSSTVVGLQLQVCKHVMNLTPLTVLSVCQKVDWYHLEASCEQAMVTTFGSSHVSNYAVALKACSYG